jgi:hypothetical protein
MCKLRHLFDDLKIYAPTHFTPLKMDLTEGSETSANINQTLGETPKS